MLSDRSESEPEECTNKKTTKKPRKHRVKKMVPQSTDHKHYKRVTTSVAQISLKEPQFEERSYNSEICMNLTELSHKLDAVLNEITSIQTNSAAVLVDQTYLQNKLVELERSSLNMKNKEKIKNLSATVENLNMEIEILQDANSSLRATVEQLNEHVEKQNEVINDLQMQKQIQYETIQMQEAELEDYKHLKRENENFKSIINGLNAEMVSKQNAYVNCNEAMRKSEKECYNVETQRFKLHGQKVRFNVRKPSDILTRTKTNSKQIRQTMSVIYQNMLERHSDADGKKQSQKKTY